MNNSNDSLVFGNTSKFRLFYSSREGNLRHKGVKNSGIAEWLGLSPKTISNHVSNMYNKLLIADRWETIERAKKEGMG